MARGPERLRAKRVREPRWRRLPYRPPIRDCRKFKLNSILAFWAAYVLTRPLGASIGDLLSQARQVPADAGPGTGKGFGLGTTTTSLIFLGAILAVIIVMTIQQRRDPVLIDETE